jgi:hypothetical protein
MVVEASRTDVQRLRKVSEGEIENLKEYISLLDSIVENLEQDIVNTRLKAKDFLRTGQKENYGHLMERIHETILRIETCKKCIEECNLDLHRKEERIKEYDHLLNSK